MLIAANPYPAANPYLTAIIATNPYSAAYCCNLVKAIHLTLECQGNLTNSLLMISYSIPMCFKSVVGIYRKIWVGTSRQTNQNGAYISLRWWQ